MPNTKHGLSGKLLLQLFIGHSGAGRTEQEKREESPPLCIFVASVSVCVCEEDGERQRGTVVVSAPWGLACGSHLYL